MDVDYSEFIVSDGFSFAFRRIQSIPEVLLKSADANLVRKIDLTETDIK
jgi:hypothetical protein